MTHIDTHAHSFLNNEYNVISTNVFEDHNVDLLNSLKDIYAANYIHCYCNFCDFSIDGIVYKDKLWLPQPTWTKDPVTGNWLVPDGFNPDGTLITPIEPSTDTTTPIN
jgi:hypothetical protein